MMYFVFKSGLEMQWHVGEKLPIGSIDDDAWDLDEIQADGDELVIFRELFPNAPLGFFSDEKVQSWSGVDAKALGCALVGFVEKEC